MGWGLGIVGEGDGGFGVRGRRGERMGRGVGEEGENRRE